MLEICADPDVIDLWQGHKHIYSAGLETSSKPCLTITILHQDFFVAYSQRALCHRLLYRRHISGVEYALSYQWGKWNISLFSNWNSFTNRKLIYYLYFLYHVYYNLIFLYKQTTSQLWFSNCFSSLAVESLRGRTWKMIQRTMSASFIHEFECTLFFIQSAL